MVYKKQSHFLFPFSRLDVHRYASRLEERKISPKIPLSPEYHEGSSSFFELELPSFYSESPFSSFARQISL